MPPSAASIAPRLPCQRRSRIGHQRGVNASSVFGIGYVGAVSGACLAAAGHQVTGVDIAPAKVDFLRRGRSPIVEALIDELIADGVAHGRLTATTDGTEAVASTDLSLTALAALLMLATVPSLTVPAEGWGGHAYPSFV